jgi:hypothetical protein
MRVVSKPGRWMNPVPKVFKRKKHAQAAGIAYRNHAHRVHVYKSGKGWVAAVSTFGELTSCVEESDV